MAWRMDIEADRYDSDGNKSEEGSEIDIESEEDDDSEVGSGSELESESLESSDKEDDIMRINELGSKLIIMLYLLEYIH